MKHEEFRIGQEFWCGGKRWRCTDIGTRVIVAICLDPHEIVTVAGGEGEASARRERRHVTDDPTWFAGPPFAVLEEVFDEHSIEGCSPSPNGE